MKKMIAIVMVLGMASLASAGLIMTLDTVVVADGANVLPGVFGLVADAPVPTFDITITFEGVTFTNPTSYPVSFDLASGVVVDPALAPNQIRLSGSQLFNAPKAGILYDGIVLGGEGVVTVYDNFNKVALGSINVIPEPMTLGLLGLGGLFLRRRK